MRFTLNGSSTDVDAHPMARLLDVLREDCGLTGTKEGCGEGECGACTVLIDGDPVCSCIVPFSQVDAAEVVTIEGTWRRSSPPALLHERGRRAVRDLHAGDDHGFNRDTRNPSLDAIKVALAGNLCRCTGYAAIYRAIEARRARGHSRAQRREAAPDMRIATSSLEVRRATSLDEALKILSDEPRMPIAGATDVYVGLNFGTLKEKSYLDIWALDELRGISVNDNVLSIGALATYTSIIRSKDVTARVPMLVEASKLVGGPQIQNRGTIGGNVANASPAGDTLPVLAAVDAVVVLRSASGERRVTFNEFYTGYRASRRKNTELIVAIEIPRVEGKQWFRKVGTRAAQAISKIVVGAVRGPKTAIAFGSVAATVVRVPKTEAALASGASIDEAARILGQEIKPIDDVRSTADYRLRVAMNLLKRFWSETA